MAIKTWQENGKTFYEIRVSARSKDRELRSEKQSSGSIDELDPIKYLPIIEHIERALEIEAHQNLVLKQKTGVLWGDLVGRWEADVYENGTESNSKIGTIRGHIQRVRDFTKLWNKRPASEITPADVSSMLGGMKKLGYSDSSRYNVKVAINQCFKWGMMRRMIPGLVISPTSVISISRKESKRPEILNYEQICFLLSEAKSKGHEWYWVWKLSLLTGTRSGEAFELRCVDIDKTEKRLFLERKYNFENKQIEGLKDHEWRQVPINDELNDLFVELKVYERNRDEYVLPRINAWKNGEAARILRSFCDEIGLPSICFHTLRACWATQLLRNGVKPVVVMAMGGWADLETMQRYVRIAGLETEGMTESLKFERKERPARVLSIVK
jgi:integrase